MENYEQKYKSALEWMRSIYPTMQGADKEDAEHHFPELRESEDERIRKEIIKLVHFFYGSSLACKHLVSANDMIAWLERQGENTSYSGISFDYNGHTWGMCAREGGVDILCDSQLIKHLEKQGEQKFWSEEDELMIQDAIHWINEFQKSNRCKDENDMQNSVTCENWLKSIKDRVQPQSTSKWSEEDEYQINTILHGLDLKRELYKKIENQVEEERYKTQYDWLKSIKPNHWKPSKQNIKDLEWCAELVKEKMGVGFHRLQVFIDEIKNI